MEAVYGKTRQSLHSGTHSHKRKNGSPDRNPCVWAKSFRQSLKVEDYGGLSQCYKVAREIRNRKLVEMKEGRYIQHAPTVKELYDEKFSLIKVRVATKRNNDIMYRAGIADFGDTPLDRITTADIQKTVNKYACTHTVEMTRKFLTV